MIKKQITSGRSFINCSQNPPLEAKPLSQFQHNLFCSDDNFIMCICRGKPLDTLRANGCPCPDRLGLQPTVDNTPSGFSLLPPPLMSAIMPLLQVYLLQQSRFETIYLILDTIAIMNLFRYSFSCHSFLKACMAKACWISDHRTTFSLNTFFLLTLLISNA
jgi:hypothetical protein